MKDLYVEYRKDVSLSGFTSGKIYKVEKILGSGFEVFDDYGILTLLHHSYFTSPPYTKEGVKQTIFTHPKWVTAKETDLEVGLIADKDYIVTKVEEDRYWVENPLQSYDPVWYKKERFYKVTPEDLLPPKKKSVEHIDEGFDGLVVNYSVFKECNYIDKTEFTSDQLEYMQKVLPSYSDYTFLDDWRYVVFSYGEFLTCDALYKREHKLAFNDIFKYSEVK